MPKKKGRQTLFKRLVEEERAVVLYESPFRLMRTLKDIEKYLGNRELVIVREITKFMRKFTGKNERIIGKIRKIERLKEKCLIIKGVNDDVDDRD
ncbi:Ribosomal RNA small subunit methyltransferase I [Fusobacterium necrophorum subsp. necrophorum]|nr:Ribosomal RNA small subunit methyltransferase I [Fusobacterium necrophorum subsp. necrophorum]